MKANEGNLNKSLGFTIVELLTVMGVIAILIGLLVPALSLVKDYSKEIQQKAQFHSIEVGLGMYKTEFGSYPPSKDNIAAYYPGPAPPADTTLGLDSAYGGANKLAEAMVGLDMLGFHPSSIFRADGRNKRDENLTPGDPPDLVPYYVYHAGVDDDPQFGESAKENVDNREGPYLELENANAFKMEDVYNDLDLSTEPFDEDDDEDSLVLCDVYAERRAHSGKKTGMPILYYRARVHFTYQDYDVRTDPEEIDIENDIYYYPDNQNLLELGLPEDQSIDHPLSDDTGLENWLDFENMIRNMQVTSVKRPYCADSYILISAGKDGMYGTADDIFNFNKEQNY